MTEDDQKTVEQLVKHAVANAVTRAIADLRAYEASQREGIGNGFEAIVAGQSFKARGQNSLSMLVVVGLMAALGFMVWRQTIEHRAIVESLEVLTYVVTKPVEERPALQIPKPDRLKPKTYQGERN